MKTDSLRTKFLDFFKNREHKVFPSDFLIPLDPSVLFTSAGMNQFKPYFLGEKKDVKKAASCQKCLRTDDLKEVGKTAYHHTFFEMLGNFSFGDYFKKEAIEFAWEFLVKELNMKEEDLWVSVYTDDEEALSVWKQTIGIDENKIVKFGADKNFWPADALLSGPNGPCGPCSEIFFDKGPGFGCREKTCSPACDCGRFVEIWNLVFTQYNRVEKNKAEPLPQKNIDTGMGLERMAGVLQGKKSNFEIDILYPVIELVKEILRFKDHKKDARFISFINAIVDHGRAATFAVADGVFPSNEDRGYVVRKLIRKAFYSAYLLGRKKPFIYKIVPLYGELMREPYPEIWDKKEDISEVILSEEEKFLRAIKTGKARFQVIIDKANKENRTVLNGEEVFKLYDTYGFGVELLEDLAQEKNYRVDLEGFKQILDKQRELSRSKSAFETNIFSPEKFSFLQTSEFVGYQSLESEVQVLEIVRENQRLSVLAQGEQGMLILDKTPFYPESGGQLSDRGVIETNEGKFSVSEVKKIKDTIIHFGDVIEGNITVTKARASVLKERRRGLERAHTATHLLQAALRKILGTHVIQQGSLVGPDKLRFDFTHFRGLSSGELIRLEEVIAGFILRADKIDKKIVSYEEAKKEKALAFFEEKYSDYVRMVIISDYSKELCGGTHSDNTSDIGSFCIISESSISSGIRRIEALVGELAYQRLFYYKSLTQEMAFLLKSKEETIPEKIKNLYKELKTQKEKIGNLERELLVYKVKDIISEGLETIGDFKAVIARFPGRDYSSLLYLSDLLRKEINSGIVCLLSSSQGKNIFVLAATVDLCNKGFSCGELIAKYRDKLHLRGGGKNSLCQGIVEKYNAFPELKEKLLAAFKETLLGNAG